ncbi:MAG: amidohydrolase family protein [Alphaproteobacteria bacterium]|nr:amidohydrolase family protein [Alphaproteobacteria bacterium]MBU1517104.1 amidohydrolase family protein [Alphaproteobacteria bacterium]MBU2093723.1 amidohydrolase family protein [Alphaproteobacteria bacterium]MBU2153955.1 amidohydrolase family protein [Alphaproteobacteria bacterium]MBU2308677.1 amidohydrolase family protein [Alphaproteobacteria bacterium]
MEKAFDLVVRGGTVVDGTGAPAFDADVAVKDGRIAAVGRIAGSGVEEIDARGQIVTPGFVDIHTHYDGQATWDGRMQPSSWHGVTTVVMGNCGVGFAPCKPEDHDRLIRLMEGVEDIPFPVLTQGLPWNWESYPEYLDSLATRSFDVDIGSQLPHAALRVFVMGERGANREPATEADINAMAALAKRAMEAGSIGFATSRTLNHRTSDGQPTPTLTAGEDELTGIALGMAAAGRGVLQMVSDFQDPEEEWAMLRRIVQRSGRPLSFSLVQSPRAPRSYQLLLERLRAANQAGLPMRAQVASRPVGILFGLELTLNPFSQHAVYREIKDQPLAERVAALRDPSFRARLLGEEIESQRSFAGSQPRNWAGMFLMDAQPDYEPTADQTVAAIAERTGRDPAVVALDHMLGQDGRGMLYLPFLNYADGNLDPAYEMLSHPDCVPGLSDGGAHVGMICDGSFPTTNLVHWTRDRTRGPKLSLEHMIKGQCRDTAETVGLYDRGVIQPGYRADLNVIDYGRLRLKAPEVAYDLPAGGRRLIQRAEGYTATILAGQVTYRDGEPTDALPGRLLRGGQAAPAKMAAE